MSDRITDDARPPVEPATSAFLDQLQKPFSAGNIADANAVAGNRKNDGQDSSKSIINELLFDPKFMQGLPNAGFKPGPYETNNGGFQKQTNTVNSDRSGKDNKGEFLELPAIVPIPRPIPPEILQKRAEAQKPAPLSSDQKLALKELTDFKPGTISGQGMTEAKGLSDQLVKEKNKVTAFPNYKERFQQAVATSDQDFFDAEKKHAPAIAAAELKYTLASSKFTDTFANFDGEIKKLPPELQAKAETLKTDLQDPAKTEKAKQRYAKEFQDYPDFVNSTTKLLADSATFIQADLDLTAARKPVVTAAYEEVSTRWLYSAAAALGGDTKLSKDMVNEAYLMAQRALEIERKEKPAPGKLVDA